MPQIPRWLGRLLIVAVLVVIVVAAALLYRFIPERRRRATASAMMTIGLLMAGSALLRAYGLVPADPVTDVVFIVLLIAGFFLALVGVALSKRIGGTRKQG